MRLISKSHHKPPVLDGLVDTEAEARALAALEGLTSARLLAEKGESDEIDRRELAYRRRAEGLRIYGVTHINAAFTYFRAGGSRFNAEGRGAWYCSWESLTAAEEVGYHRTRELIATGHFHDSAQYVEMRADFIGDFPDLHHKPEHAALDPDPAIGYPAGQALARELQQQGATGIIYPSARHRGGRCFVALEPHIVQNVTPGATWEFTWSGAPEFTMRAI